MQYQYRLCSSLGCIIRRRGLSRELIKQLLLLKEKEGILELNGDIAYGALGFYEKMEDLGVTVYEKQSSSFKSFKI